MNLKFKQECGYRFRNLGFTLLEVMIAMSIFGFLILYVSQMTRMEFRLFNTFSKQNDLDHNIRAAMMHIIDEIRLNPNTNKPSIPSPIPSVKKYYYAGDVSDNKNKGIYYNYYLDPTDPTSQITCCLINVNPSDVWLSNPSLSGPVIYLSNNELWYRGVDDAEPPKIISDQIRSVDLSLGILGSIDTLIKIEITAMDDSKLISWIRLY
jgi:prepilin-type N-terminal cleavage/methylation domain-containing protein